MIRRERRKTTKTRGKRGGGGCNPSPPTRPVVRERPKETLTTILLTKRDQTTGKNKRKNDQRKKSSHGISPLRFESETVGLVLRQTCTIPRCLKNNYLCVCAVICLPISLTRGFPESTQVSLTRYRVRGLSLASTTRSQSATTLRALSWVKAASIALHLDRAVPTITKKNSLDIVRGTRA